MSYTFDQIHSGYTYKGVSMKVAGCGECSVASLVYNLKPDKKLNEEVMRYAVDKGYMPAGTTRTGITEMLKHYGTPSVMYQLKSGFNTLMDKISETGYGILLMYGIKKGGDSNKWTSGGHYISITAYDVEKGFYVRDSACRNTGWHKRSEFKGCMVAGWAIADTWSKAPQKAPEPKPVEGKCYPKYTGSSTSIVDALKAVGEKDTSLSHRMAIANHNNISAANNTLMNIRLLEALKAGTLKKE